MQTNTDYITDTERDLLRYIPCLSKTGTVYLLNPFTLEPAKPFLDSLRWQVFGELETPVRPEYTPREARTLHTLGNILRTHPALTVAECERLYGEAQRDLRHAWQVVMQIIDRDQQALHLHRMAEAGAYDVETAEERELTFAQSRDFERRMDYLEKRDGMACKVYTDMHYADGGEEEQESVFHDGAFRGLLFALVLVSVAVVFGAIFEALRLL